MRALFLENDDSFSWNVVDALPLGREEICVRSTRARPVAPSTLERWDLLVIGPGPMDPVRVGLVDVVRAATAIRVPILGVCLGHQAIGLAFGARLSRVLPVHGKVSVAVFSPSRLFPGFAGPVDVMRYHSLALEDVRPPLRAVAATGDGVVMAVEHESLPVAGVQFHPDSYATPRGRALLASCVKALTRGSPHA